MIHFSVIIPVYNKEKYIRRAIDSIMIQKTESLNEIIIVDDCSTDNSLHIVKEYSDSRIKILNRNSPGAGGYAARNYGIMEARNKWISFLDADDEWLPESMDRLVDFANRSTDLSFFAQGWLRKHSDCEEPDLYFQQYKGDGPSILSLEDYIRRSCKRYPAIHTNSVLIKKELLVEAGLFPESEKRGGDVDLWLRCLLLTEKFGYYPHLGSRYYLSLPGAVTTSSNAIYGIHPVKKTIDKQIVKRHSFSRGVLRSIKRYSDIKIMDWMEEQKRRRKVHFKSFRYLNYPLSPKALRMFVAFAYHKIRDLFHMAS